MGSSQSKDERKAARPNNIRHTSGQTASGQPSPSSMQTPADRLAGRIYAQRNGNARGSRPDLTFLHSGRVERDGETQQQERPRETKQERDARRVERERQARLKERERSLREEHVDGGFLVTLGTYTGPEDFSKLVVRQLQIERKLAPFWKGLNDHKDFWTEAQLVAAARGLPIPAADEIPPEMMRSASQTSSNRPASELHAKVNSLTVPITQRSQSYQLDSSGALSASHPTFSPSSGPSSPTGLNPSNPLFRGRAKTLASTLSGKSQSPDISPQEIQLPSDPYVNGQPIEAYLYKDALECPICYMWYPPYLNKTRCCDQPICSECFVQIKRPDPHPPEHEQPGQHRPPEEEAETLVSEVASCPFCVTPEFGVTYDAPPFRRGLAYSHQQSNPLKTTTSAMSSTTSLPSPAAGGRRRATSLSANSSRVITTDRVRPEWAKKLADARAHALRRSAAATALHNAAYVLGNSGDAQFRGALIGRRRRTLFGDSPNASGSGTPAEGDSGGDLVSRRLSSRQTRVEDIEELMMMEAIRLSLAAEEERKRKEEKENAKELKKKAKAEKKEEKKADKAARKNGGKDTLYGVGSNDSSSTWASTSMARSTSNLGQHTSIPEEPIHGKGKQPLQDFAGYHPLTEPTSTLNMGTSPGHPVVSTPAVGDAQQHLEKSRANIQPSPSGPITIPSPHSPHLRQLSNASSAASSFIESPHQSGFLGDSNVPSHSGSGIDVTAGAQQDASNLSSGAGTPAATAPSNLEPMFNFRSLTAMISDNDKNASGNEHVENAEPPSQAEEQLKEPSPTGSPRMAPTTAVASVDGHRSRGDNGESSSSPPPPISIETPSKGVESQGGLEGKETGVALAPTTSTPIDEPISKEIGNLEVADHGDGRTEAR